ncbi:MAG: DUF1963 domain-containing protein [Coleofasciculaceae cyanobacterium SM2_1_6]|nr:DUF1963 domain-containing protein [Coleofasciculaceae cyanobacterium SM2_1_6]
MPSYSIPADNGKYDTLIQITLEGCTVTIQENDGRSGEGETVFCEVHEFTSETKAQEFFQEQCRRDPYYSPPTDEEITLQRGEPVYLTFSDARSHKFYEVTVTGVEVHIRYGRIGSKGQVHHSTEITTDVALATAMQKINDKLKKGYLRSPSTNSTERSQQSELSPSTPSAQTPSPSTNINASATVSATVLALAATLQAGGELFWQISPLKLGVTVQIVAISHSPLFSCNLMAGEDFAYHCNPRTAEAQIVQNTRIGQNWGLEERLLLPQDMAFGQTFTLTISVQDNDLILSLNGAILHHYQHRISPTQINGLRLICSQGHLHTLSVQVAELASPPESLPLSSSPIEETDVAELDIQQVLRSAPAWLPIVVDGDGDRLASKFGGRPWLAIDEAWPTCPTCPQPMQLFLQLNLGNLPGTVREEFGSGLLQVFHCLSETCQSVVEYPGVYYGRVPSVEQSSRTRLVNPVGSGSTPPLPEILGEPYESFPAKTIIDWQIIDDYPDPDELGFSDDEWDEIVERFGLNDLIDYEDQYPTNNTDKLGGYPCWVQDVEYPGCPVCLAPMRLVFQLASGKNLSYAFGDMGIAYVLQCQTHKDQFAFISSCG